MKNVIAPPNTPAEAGRYYDGGSQVIDQLVTELASALDVGGVYRVTFGCAEIALDQDRDGKYVESPTRLTVVRLLIPGTVLAEIASRLQEVADYHAKQCGSAPVKRKPREPKPKQPTPLPPNVVTLRPN